ALRPRSHATSALPRICAALVFAAAVALCAARAAAQETSPATSRVTWRMTTEYPENNISGIGLVTFSKRVAERTGGFVTTSNAFDNELKITSIDMPRAAQEGRIAGGDAFVGPLSAREAVFGLPTLPFVVQSVEKALAAQGLKLLYVTIWPATGLWSDR